MKARRERPDPGGKEILDAVDAALRESVACGTAIVGRHQQHARHVRTADAAARWPRVVFYELIRFNAPDPRGLVQPP